MRSEKMLALHDIRAKEYEDSNDRKDNRTSS